MAISKSSAGTNWALIGGITAVIIIIAIVVYFVMNNKDKKDHEKTTTRSVVSGGGGGGGGAPAASLNELKDKVQEFQKGNAAALQDDLSCYADILYDAMEGKLNTDPDNVLAVVDKPQGLVASDYASGLLSSVSILSKELQKRGCKVYTPLTAMSTFLNISKDTIFTSSGIKKVFDNESDPVGQKYTDFSFVTLVQFLSNLYKEGQAKRILEQSNNLKALNTQLVKANAFKPDFAPVDAGGSSTVITTPSTTININVTTASPGGGGGGGDWNGGGGGGDWNGGGDWGGGGDDDPFAEETTTRRPTTTTTTTTAPPMDLDTFLQKKFAPYAANKLKDYIIAKVDQFYPKNWPQLGDSAKMIRDLFLGVGLLNVIQKGVTSMIQLIKKGSVVPLNKINAILAQTGDSGSETLWGSLTGGPGMTSLENNMVGTLIKSVIDQSLLPLIRKYAIDPVVNAVKSGLEALLKLVGMKDFGSFIIPYVDGIGDQIADVVSDLAHQLGTWLAGLYASAKDKLISFFNDFVSSPITALKNLKNTAGSAMGTFTWSWLWGEIKKVMARVLSSMIDAVHKQFPVFDSTAAKKIVTDKINGSSAEGYTRNYQRNEQLNHFARHTNAILEAFTDIHGFNRAMQSEEFKYLRPQLSQFANTREFFDIMY
jgi:hypothetical protein